MFRRPRPLDFLLAALLIAAIVGAGGFFHIRDLHRRTLAAAPDADLTWICVSLDGSHSALAIAIAPGGEGTIRISDRAHAAYEVRMRLCDQLSAMDWTKAKAPATSIFPPRGTSR